jgi:hypothetical protein
MTEGNSRRERTGFLKSEIWMMLLLLVFGELAGIGAAVGTRHAAPGLSNLFATAATTLLFGSLLGGIVTLLIANFDRRRVQRAAQLDFIANVLTDLKDVHDQVDRGRTLIKAHRSAKTYGEEMRGFIQARIKLQNVARALQTDERRKPILGVGEKVGLMEKYLRELLEEYEGEYKTVSLEQSIFEAQLKRALEAPPSAEHSVESLPPNTPWEKLERLDRLKDFLLPIPAPESGSAESTSKYMQSFRQPLDAASEQLRAALAAQLSSQTGTAEG